jgi:transposase-like protein
MRLQIPYGKISGYKVGKILKHFVVDVEANKTAELLNLNRKTVDDYYNLFRKLIYVEQTTAFAKLNGTLEIDESYFGARRVRGLRIKLKRGRGTRKQPVFSIYQRGGRVYTEIVPNCLGTTLQHIIEHIVSENAEVNSDGWRGYDGLVDVGYDNHYRVNHGDNEWSDEHGHHINGIENFWSCTKRRMQKHNGVRKTYFELFLKECEWRYNEEDYEQEAELKKLLNHYIRYNKKGTSLS